MYGGKDLLTKETLLNKVSEYQIFKHYCNNFVSIGKRFCSELRADKKPSCVVYNTPSGFFYKDFGTGEVFDCFNYVKQYLKNKFNLEPTFDELINIIGNDLNLIKNIRNIVPASANYVGLADKFDRTSRKIAIKSRPWYKVDTYWEDYSFKPELLKFYKVIPLSNYWVSSKSSDELNLIYSWDKNIFDYAYAYNHGKELYKILRPYNEEFKWLSNIPRNILSGWDQLENTADILIVTKSLKDCMAWKMFGYNAVSPQSESSFMNINTFELLKYRFKEIIINYDGDKHGLNTMESVKEEFGINRFIFHDNKDISDSLYFKGFEYTKNIITNLKNNLF